MKKTTLLRLQKRKLNFDVRYIFAGPPTYCWVCNYNKFTHKTELKPLATIFQDSTQVKKVTLSCLAKRSHESQCKLQFFTETKRVAS